MSALSTACSLHSRMHSDYVRTSSRKDQGNLPAQCSRTDDELTVLQTSYADDQLGGGGVILYIFSCIWEMRPAQQPASQLHCKRCPLLLPPCHQVLHAVILEHAHFAASTSFSSCHQAYRPWSSSNCLISVTTRSPACQRKWQTCQHWPVSTAATASCSSCQTHWGSTSRSFQQSQLRETSLQTSLPVRFASGGCCSSAEWRRQPLSPFMHTTSLLHAIALLPQLPNVLCRVCLGQQLS